MKNKNNLKFDVKKLSKFYNGMKTIRTIIIIVLFFLTIPNFSSAANCGTLKDVENNTYSTTVIGTQCWMAENLRVTKFSDGVVIPRPSHPAWIWCNPAGCGSPWGRHYGWDVVMDGNTNVAEACGRKIQGVCPVGWRVPSDKPGCSNDDFQKLSSLLGGDSVSGRQLKSSSIGGTNTVGFSAIGAGWTDG